MLMTRMTPNVIASPRAVRMRRELRLRLLESAAPMSVTLMGNSSNYLQGRRALRASRIASVPRRAPWGWERLWRAKVRLVVADLYLRALGDAALGPIAVPAGEGNLRIRLRLNSCGRRVEEFE